MRPETEETLIKLDEILSKLEIKEKEIEVVYSSKKVLIQTADEQSEVLLKSYEQSEVLLKSYEQSEVLFQTTEHSKETFCSETEEIEKVFTFGNHSQRKDVPKAKMNQGFMEDVFHHSESDTSSQSSLEKESEPSPLSPKDQHFQLVSEANELKYDGKYVEAGMKHEESYHLLPHHSSAKKALEMYIRGEDEGRYESFFKVAKSYFIFNQSPRNRCDSFHTLCHLYMKKHDFYVILKKSPEILLSCVNEVLNSLYLVEIESMRKNYANDYIRLKDKYSTRVLSMK